MIASYCTDTVVLLRASGRDKYGEPLPDTEITLKGKVKKGTALVKDIKGENVYSSMSVMLKSRAVSHEDYIRYDGKDYAILSISRPEDFSWSFLEVFLK